MTKINCKNKECIYNSKIQERCSDCNNPLSYMNEKGYVIHKKGCIFFKDIRYYDKLPHKDDEKK